MSILSYVQRLAPTYERKEILSALEQLRDELRDHTLPVAQDTREAFGGLHFKSQYGKAFTEALRRKVRLSDNGATELVESLELLDRNLDFLEKEVKREFSLQFSTSTITYTKANLLKYIEVAGFYVRYFRKLMLRVIAEEALVVGKATPLRWSRAELQWLEKGLTDFVALYPVIRQEPAKLAQTIGRISNAQIDEQTYEIAVQSLGGGKMDPMQLGLVDPASNPIFWLGSALAEWQVKKYQEAKEEHQALQLRLQEWREISSEGKVDPKLQKLIQHTESRIEELDYKIAKIEEANAID